VNAEPRHHLYAVIRGFRTALLITHAADGGMHARPLAVADVPADGEILFATSSSSPKIAEIEADPRVLISFQNGAQFACVCGTARVSRDRARLQQLWSESWRIWYPAGVDDPSLCLLAVQPSAGEYWDNAGVKGLKYLFQGATAYIRGDRLSTDAVHAHAKVDLKS
jgi:general stress protein 26